MVLYRILNSLQRITHVSTHSFSGVWILCVCVQPDLAPTPASDARELPDYHSDHCEEGKDDEESE